MIIQKKGEQYFVTLPKLIVQGIGWDRGDVLDVKIAGKDRLELVRRAKA